MHALNNNMIVTCYIFEDLFFCYIQLLSSFHFQVKAIAKSQVFESAQVLVRQVTDDHLKPEQPEGARPSHEGLLKMCNRARKQLRPQDPENLDFEVS